MWSTDESCYRFIAETARPRMRTLETGSGLSTALFAALGTDHTCVTPADVEAEHLRRYFDEQQISGDRVTFVIDLSDVALPKLEGELDLVLIDGAHGFPLPMLDWFYACSHLRCGGVVVIDDVPLPAVAVLIEFLDADPRWERLAGTEKWGAYRRRSQGSLLEGQWDQRFYTPGIAPPTLSRRVLRRLRRELARRVPR